jgi:hypothetical protein
MHDIIKLYLPLTTIIYIDHTTTAAAEVDEPASPKFGDREITIDRESKTLQVSKMTSPPPATGQDSLAQRVMHQRSMETAAAGASR